MHARRTPPVIGGRPRTRSARSWRATLSAVALTSALTLAGTPAAAHAATDPQVRDARDRAAGWLAARQQPDGSLGRPGGLDPAWALLGLAGAGRHAADLRVTGGRSAQDEYVGLWSGPDDTVWSSNGALQATDYARTTLIAHAAGVDPTRIAPTQNLTAKLARFWRDGYFQSRTALLNQTIFGLLALERVDAVPPAFVEQLARNVEAAQHLDGGYSFVTAETTPAVPGGASPLASGSDIDFTGAALAALCGAGRTITDPTVSGAIAFLRSKRLGSGAIGSGTIGNVDSTAWALQGLGACGLRRGTEAWATSGFETTVDWLLGTQGPEGGWAVYPEMGGTPPADAYATQDALRALGERPGFAVDPPERTAPGDPRWRPVPETTAGAPISVALAIDDGLGGRTLCEVATVQGTALREVLQAARETATPAGCVRSPQWKAGALAALNGRRSTDPAGGWRVSVDGGTTEDVPTATRPVVAGGVVALRLVAPSAEPVSEDPNDPDPETPGPGGEGDGGTDGGGGGGDGPGPGGTPPPGGPGGVPPQGPEGPDPAATGRKAAAPSVRVRTLCRRTSRHRAVRCTVRAAGRLSVTSTLPGRKAVRRTAQRQVVTVVRSPRALRAAQRVRLRIAVGARSRVVTVRADGRNRSFRI